jgi:hypothetical protein
VRENRDRLRPAIRNASLGSSASPSLDPANLRKKGASFIN